MAVEECADTTQGKEWDDVSAYLGGLTKEVEAAVLESRGQQAAPINEALAVLIDNEQSEGLSMLIAEEEPAQVTAQVCNYECCRGSLQLPQDYRLLAQLENVEWDAPPMYMVNKPKKGGKLDADMVRAKLRDYKPCRIVVDGPKCVGKTSLLQQLEYFDYNCIPDNQPSADTFSPQEFDR